MPTVRRLLLELGITGESETKQKIEDIQRAADSAKRSLVGLNEQIVELQKSKGINVSGISGVTSFFTGEGKSQVLSLPERQALRMENERFKKEYERQKEADAKKIKLAEDQLESSKSLLESIKEQVALQKEALQKKVDELGIDKPKMLQLTTNLESAIDELKPFVERSKTLGKIGKPPTKWIKRPTGKSAGIINPKWVTREKERQEYLDLFTQAPLQSAKLKQLIEKTTDPTEIEGVISNLSNIMGKIFEGLKGIPTPKIDISKTRQTKLPIAPKQIIRQYDPAMESLYQTQQYIAQNLLPSQLPSQKAMTPKQTKEFVKKQSINEIKNLPTLQVPKSILSEKPDITRWVPEQKIDRPEPIKLPEQKEEPKKGLDFLKMFRESDKSFDDTLDEIIRLIDKEEEEVKSESKKETIIEKIKRKVKKEKKNVDEIIKEIIGKKDYFDVDDLNRFEVYKDVLNEREKVKIQQKTSKLRQDFEKDLDREERAKKRGFLFVPERLNLFQKAKERVSKVKEKAEQIKETSKEFVAGKISKIKGFETYQEFKEEKQQVPKTIADSSREEITKQVKNYKIVFNNPVITNDSEEDRITKKLIQALEGISDF